MSAVAVIDGVKIPDPAMAQLIRDAVEQGFRFEAGTNKRHAAETGFTLYPPDKEHRPIFVGCDRISPIHVSNIRRALLRAGFTDSKETDDVSRQQKQQKMVGVEVGPGVTFVGPSETSGEFREFAESIRKLPAAERRDFLCDSVGAVARLAAVDDDVAVLAGAVIEVLFGYSENRVHLCDDKSEEIEQALKMAHEAEERATSAEKRLDAAKKDASNLGKQLTETLKRAETAETEVRKLRAAIDPLKALLGSQS